MLKKLVIVGSLLAVGPFFSGCMTNSQALYLAVEAAPLVLEAADKATDAIKRNMAKSRRMAALKDRKTTATSPKVEGRKHNLINVESHSNDQLCRAVFAAKFDSAARFSALKELRKRGELGRCSLGTHQSLKRKSAVNISTAAAEARRRAAEEDRKFALKSGAGRQNEFERDIERARRIREAKARAYKKSQNNQAQKKFLPYLKEFSRAELCDSISKFPHWHDAHRHSKAELRYRDLTCDEAATSEERDRAQRSENEKKRLAELQRQRKAEERRLAEARRKRQAEEARRVEAERKRRAEAKRQAEAKRKADAAKKSKLYRVGSGSGFSISRDGLIVTNHHVIDGCSAVAVSDKGEMYRAIVQSVDERNDLALLKSKLRPAHVFALNPEGTDILREIYVAGYPFGRMVSNSVKVTKGIVSSLVGLENNSAQIQIDAPIQVGNSGGPILDSEGRVVGVSVSKLDAFEVMKKKKQIPEGVGFGVKSETLIQMLKSSGVRTYKRGGLKTTAEIANAIRGGTFYISCLMTAERYKRLKGKKAMFEGVNLD